MKWKCITEVIKDKNKKSEQKAEEDKIRIKSKFEMCKYRDAEIGEVKKLIKMEINHRKWWKIMR